LRFEICLTMKLHAVAPRGPPEGQYKKTQDLVGYTSFDSSFRTPITINTVWLEGGWYGLLSNKNSVIS
jgi:hypothetical protein